uniref:Sushi domain-containing protein n=1 Tax=Pyrodinium bahamense TaxID=73915 RepID=A0A7S0BDC7_9DINO
MAVLPLVLAATALFEPLGAAAPLTQPVRPPLSPAAEAAAAARAEDDECLGPLPGASDDVVALQLVTAAAKARDEQCQEGSFQMTFGEDAGTFAVPGNTDAGTLVHFPCKFGDTMFPHGQLTFECRADGWHYKSLNCSMCPATSLPVATGSLTGSFDLPSSLKVGEKAELTCKGMRAGQDVYRYGVISFTCQRDGGWAFEEETCAVCWHGDMNVTYGGDWGVFPLPLATGDGEEVLHPCEFKREKFPYGSIKFVCQAGAWKYAGDTCAVCTATNLTVEHGGHRGTYELPRASGTGTKMQKPCAFGGTTYQWGAVDFECREGGWVVFNDTCAACAMTKFRVTHGEDEGMFELPRAATDGEVHDEACVFGEKSYASGVVRFACEAGKWNLKTVTCAA